MNLTSSLLIVFCLMAGAWSINASTPSFILTNFHYGLEGSAFLTTSYAGTETLTHEQAGTQNATTFHFALNYGWFNISITINPTILIIVSDLQLNNATAGHAFTATATVSDPFGGNAITSVQIDTTAGNCVQYLNSTSGVNFTALFVCITTIPATSNIFITFNDSALGASIATSTSSNTYPDHPATLGAPVISPNPAYNDSNLSCNNGVFSDPDGDLGNSQTWAWAKNGIYIVGENTQNLNMGNFTIGDSIVCEENATSTIWLGSNGTAISSPVVIGIRPAGIYLEIIGFLALICLAMFFISELSPSNTSIGMIGGILLVVIGVWALNEPIVIHTGDITSYAQNSTLNLSSLNLTNMTITTFSQNKTMIYKYTPISIPLVQFNTLFGIIMLAIGILACFRYAFIFKG